MSEKERIQQLYQDGYIQEKAPIAFLLAQLHGCDPESRELAARTLIEEVVGSQYMNLRLEALDTLMRMPRRASRPDSPGCGQIDLHTHSAAFDGYQTPTALILEAFEQGLAAVAITDHNKPPFDENIEAEKAAERLGFCFYKGSEISADFDSEVTQSVETVHILEIPAHPPKSPRTLVKRYARDFTQLGVLSDLLFPLINLWALRYTDSCTRSQVDRKLEKMAAQCGPALALSAEDLRKACRGDLPIPFTIALALWMKYREVLAHGLQVSGPRGVKTIGPLRNLQEVYRHFLISPNGGRTRVKKKRSGPPPDLYGLEQMALTLDHKLILAHPNEYPLELVEEVMEKTALVRMEGGRQYAGVFIGVEYYSHKLQGEHKEYIRRYVDWLNAVHPVYKDFPLRLFPGSDTHGKFTPDRPLGLGDNYPADQEAYNRALKQALATPPRALSPAEQERLQGELERWGPLREQRPPDLEELRHRLQ